MGASLLLAVLSIIPLIVTGALSPETALLPLPVALISLLMFQGVVWWKQGLWSKR